MTQVKICGITTAQDALTALAAGADMLGLNFYPPSPRFLDEDIAVAVAAAVPSGARLIGVFVNPQEAAAVRLVERLSLCGVQLHGEESAPLIAALARRIPVIKAVRNYEQAQQALALGCHILLDAPSIVRGGSGQLSDWALARELASQTPHFYLAGGLTPENVRQAVSLVQPFAVDVATGVELSPRQKSAALLREFVHAARNGVPA
ncbi:MAG: phosphoribosylanthranilate isomerase [Terriglobales bacterium]